MHILTRLGGKLSDDSYKRVHLARFVLICFFYLYLYDTSVSHFVFLLILYLPRRFVFALLA